MKSKLIKRLEKITDEYGTLHDESCDDNSENGSYDGCDCAMSEMVKEIAVSIQSLIEEIIPEKKDNSYKGKVLKVAEAEGFNECREQTLKNLKELL
jgi:hypothetical protein